MAETLTPKHYENFKCIGPECEDNCCQGFVTIGLKKKEHHYLMLKAKLTEKEKSYFVKDHSDPNAYSLIDQKQTGMCPFWKTDKLCGLYEKIGYSRLPNVCQIFPRGTLVRAGRAINTLVLSCPEAARLILFDQDAWQMTSTHDRKAKPKKDNAMPPYSDMLMAFIDQIFRIEDASLEEKFYTLGIVLANLDPYKNQPLTDMLDAVDVMHEHISQGHMRTMYFQQPSSVVLQAEVFKNCIQYMHTSKLILKNSTLYQRLETRLYTTLDKSLKTKNKFDASGAWFDCLSDVQAQKRYEKYMAQQPHLWPNFMQQVMLRLSFPKSSFQDFFDVITVCYFIIRSILIILASNQDLTDADVLQCVSFISKISNDFNLKEVLFNLSKLFNLNPWLTDNGFSLHMLFALKYQLNDAELAIQRGELKPESPTP